MPCAFSCKIMQIEFIKDYGSATFFMKHDRKSIGSDVCISLFSSSFTGVDTNGIDLEYSLG